MIIHVGGDEMLPIKNIIAILDARSVRLMANKAAYGWLFKACADVGQQQTRSYIITQTQEGQKVYASPILPQTLLNRAANNKL